MKQYPRTLDADETVGAAAQTMLWHRFRHLPILHEDKLVGVVSDRDLAWYTARVGAGASAHSVREAMQARPQTAAPDDSLTEAAARMAASKIGCLPITERGVLVGLVTITDVLAAQVREALGQAVTDGPDVASVMTVAPITAHADDDLLDAAGRMQHANVRHLPVVDGEHKVVGIFSDRDLRSAVGYIVRALADQSPRDELSRLKVRQVMVRDVVTTTPDHPLKALAAELAGLAIGAVPVVDADGKLVGIVSVVDVLRGLAGGRTDSRRRPLAVQSGDGR